MVLETRIRPNLCFSRALVAVIMVLAPRHLVDLVNQGMFTPSWQSQLSCTIRFNSYLHSVFKLGSDFQYGMVLLSGGFPLSIPLAPIATVNYLLETAMQSGSVIFATHGSPSIDLIMSDSLCSLTR